MKIVLTLSFASSGLTPPPTLALLGHSWNFMTLALSFILIQSTFFWLEESCLLCVSVKRIQVSTILILAKTLTYSQAFKGYDNGRKKWKISHVSLKLAPKGTSINVKHVTTRPEIDKSCREINGYLFAVKSKRWSIPLVKSICFEYIIYINTQLLCVYRYRYIYIYNRGYSPFMNSRAIN